MHDARTDTTIRMVVEEARRLIPLRGTSYSAMYMYRIGVPPPVAHRILEEAPRRPISWSGATPSVFLSAQHHLTIAFIFKSRLWKPSTLAKHATLSFATRLIHVIEMAGYSSSASSFARELNARSPGHVVTSHGARKWLTGEAFPNQHRLKHIAEVLGVSAAWLRFGEDNHDTNAGAQFENSETLALLLDYGKLEERQKTLVRQLVSILLGSELTGSLR